MLTVQSSVVGDDAVKAQFVELGSAVRQRVRAALRGLGREAQAVAQSRAPWKTGALIDSIKVRLSNGDGKSLTMTVSPTGKRNFVARLMEFGVVAHGWANNKALRGNKRSMAAIVRQRRAAGLYRIEPRPFMAAAEAVVRSKLDAALGAALDAAAQEAS
jgi:hypothetical protein